MQSGAFGVDSEMKSYRLILLIQILSFRYLSGNLIKFTIFRYNDLIHSGISIIFFYIIFYKKAQDSQKYRTFEKNLIRFLPFVSGSSIFFTRYRFAL